MSSKRSAGQALKLTVDMSVQDEDDAQFGASSDGRLNYQGQAFSDADLQAGTVGKLAWRRSVASLCVLDNPVIERRTCP